MRRNTPILSLEKIEDVENKLWEVATYVSNLGSSKLEAEKLRQNSHIG